MHKGKAALIAMILALPHAISRPCQAQQWTDHVRGSWVSEADGVTLAENGSGCAIVVAENEDPAVKQAAIFLAGDIEKISGARPAIGSAKPQSGGAIHLVTLGNGELPASIDTSKLKDQWEAYQIVASDRDVWLVGSNFRGTAFAAYTLSERLGVDPLYLWTGFTPEKHAKLVMKAVNLFVASPTFKYRGMFHDDEDILPRPFEPAGYPDRNGDVPLAWYARFFETALRLRMNMVAPYTRVHRRYEVQKLASDWGLFFTSHHYDVLLSNPYGMVRFGLGKARGAGTDWDWYTNRQGMLAFWRGGVEENKDLNCIWPVGLRGTEDRSYRFPPGTTDAQRDEIFNSVINAQVQMTKDLAPKDKPPIFHFTLYSEMLTKYQTGTFNLPEDVIIVWTDDNDGIMRALPKSLGKWKHGVYYHLAYLGRALTDVKQSATTVSPARIAEQFRKIVDAGATEYMKVNVSELREFVREARMIADISWDAKTALAGDRPDQRYVHWFCREYFGDEAAPDAARALAEYAGIFDAKEKQFYGAERFHIVIENLLDRFTGKTPISPTPELRVELAHRNEAHEHARATVESAMQKMAWPARQYFADSISLPLRFDSAPTEAALMLLKAVDEPDDAKAWPLIVAARAPLETLETEILRAEHPPFENWYRHTWIRQESRPSNVHRSYEELRLFLATRGAGRLIDEEKRIRNPATQPNPR